MPKLIFVGDGPARKELETKCKEANYDAEFLGHKQGEELAECYASADVFAFPSFTEVCVRAHPDSPFLNLFFDRGIMGNADVSIAVDIWPSCTRSASLRFGKFPDSLISLVFWPFPGDC